MTDEKKVEAVIIAMLSASSELASLPIQHSDATDSTQGEDGTIIEYVTVEATKGSMLLDGAGGASFDLAINYFSTTEAGDSSARMKAVESAIERPSPEQVAAASVKASELSINFFHIEPNANSDTQADGLSRSRNRNWSVISAS